MYGDPAVKSAATAADAYPRTSPASLSSSPSRHATAACPAAVLSGESGGASVRSAYQATSQTAAAVPHRSRLAFADTALAGLQGLDLTVSPTEGDALRIARRRAVPPSSTSEGSSNTAPGKSGGGIEECATAPIGPSSSSHPNAAAASQGLQQQQQQHVDAAVPRPFIVEVSVVPLTDPFRILRHSDVVGGLVRIPKVATTSLLSFAFGLVTCWAAMRRVKVFDRPPPPPTAAAAAVAVGETVSSGWAALPSLLRRSFFGVSGRAVLLAALRWAQVATLVLWFRRFLRSRIVSARPVSIVENASATPFGVAYVSRSVLGLLGSSHAGTHADQPPHYCPPQGQVRQQISSPQSSSSLSLEPFPIEHYCGSAVVIDVSDLIEAQWARAFAEARRRPTPAAVACPVGKDNGATSSSSSRGLCPIASGDALAITEAMIRAVLQGEGCGAGAKCSDGEAQPTSQRTVVSGDAFGSEGGDGGDEDGGHASKSCAGVGASYPQRSAHTPSQSSPPPPSCGLELDTVYRVLFITRRRRADRRGVRIGEGEGAPQGVDEWREAFFGGYGMASTREEAEAAEVFYSSSAAAAAAGPSYPYRFPPANFVSDAFDALQCFPAYTAAGHSTSFLTPKAAEALAELLPRAVLVGIDGPEMGHPCPRTLLALSAAAAGDTVSNTNTNTAGNTSNGAETGKTAAECITPKHEGPHGIFHRRGIAVLEGLWMEPVARTMGGGAVGRRHFYERLRREAEVADAAAAFAPSAAGADGGNGGVSTAEDLDAAQGGTDADDGLYGDEPALPPSRFAMGVLMTVFSATRNFADAKGCSVIFFPSP